jgi:uncharacterized protein
LGNKFPISLLFWEKYINKLFITNIMLIKRDIFSKLINNLKNNKIVALVGSRQVGKTTLMKAIKKETNNSEYLTFDDLEILDLFENNIKLFIEKYVKPNNFLFIDEFQYAKNGGKNLKYIYDTEKCKLFISGSSSPELTINSLQYLVGRVKIINIHPLTFEEFLEYKDNKKTIFLKSIREQELQNLKNYFEEYLKYGGYPGIVTSNEKSEDLKNLIKTYLFKEIKDILAYKNIYEYEVLMKGLSVQDGSLLNKSNISNDLDINRKKIDEFIHVLANTFILNIVKPFYKNKSKELIKSPKVYFQDLGLKNSLLNNFNELNLREDKGTILESFILSQFTRNNFELNFWNWKNIHEMDFVFEKDGQVIGIEVKSKLKSSKLNTSMKKFIDEKKPSKIYIFNENIQDKFIYEKTEIIFLNHLQIYQVIKSI